MKNRPVPPAIACPGCGRRLKFRGEFWMCLGNPDCHMAVLACPDCSRPMQHFDGGARCAHCQTEWRQAQQTGGAGA